MAVIPVLAMLEWQGTGGREQEAGGRKQGTGSREQEAGGREQEAGNRGGYKKPRCLKAAGALG